MSLICLRHLVVRIPVCGTGNRGSTPLEDNFCPYNEMVNGTLCRFACPAARDERNNDAASYSIFVMTSPPFTGVYGACAEAAESHVLDSQRTGGVRALSFGHEVCLCKCNDLLLGVMTFYNY